MVRRLRLMHDVDPRPRHVVAACLLRGLLGRASFAPVVPLINVVIIGDGNARPIAGQLAPRPAVHVPLAEIVENCRFQRRSLDAIAAAALIELIADEGYEIGI